MIHGSVGHEVALPDLLVNLLGQRRVSRQLLVDRQLADLRLHMQNKQLM